MACPIRAICIPASSRPTDGSASNARYERSGERRVTFLLLFSEDRADPALDTLGVDVHPIVRPVDGFRIPADALQILGREHPGSFTDVFRLENETVVKSKRQKLIQSDFLSADLPPRIPESLQVGPHPVLPE